MYAFVAPHGHFTEQVSCGVTISDVIVKVELTGISMMCARQTMLLSARLRLIYRPAQLSARWSPAATFSC